MPTIIGLGIAGSLYTAHRIARSRYQTANRRRATLLPCTAVIAGLGALNVFLFTLPMAHRM